MTITENQIKEYMNEFKTSRTNAIKEIKKAIKEFSEKQIKEMQEFDNEAKRKYENMI